MPALLFSPFSICLRACSLAPPPLRVCAHALPLSSSLHVCVLYFILCPPASPMIACMLAFSLALSVSVCRRACSFAPRLSTCMRACSSASPPHCLHACLISHQPPLPSLLCVHARMLSRAPPIPIFENMRARLYCFPSSLGSFACMCACSFASPLYYLHMLSRPPHPPRASASACMIAFSLALPLPVCMRACSLACPSPRSTFWDAYVLAFSPTHAPC